VYQAVTSPDRPQVPLPVPQTSPSEQPLISNLISYRFCRFLKQNVLGNQIAEYQLKNITNKNIPLEEQVKYFYENRMLLIRICEEQLHLIQRHSDHEGDFAGSKAWELLFEVFRFHRQSFAEMKAPSDHTSSKKSYSDALKGQGILRPK
jgi:hypothetical protein